MTMEQKKEIIDNETGNFLSTFLNEQLAKHRKVDIASGFFNVGGYIQVADTLRDMSDKPDSTFRLLFGKESLSDIEPNNIDYHNTVLGDIDTLDMDGSEKKSVDSLIEFLKRDNVMVKKSRGRFSHAKCYIFGNDNAVVGSSNFTHAGLRENIELNAVLYQPSALKLVADWFERRWEDADDTKTELIQMIEESKFGLPLEPYTMYMKMLYEYYKQRIDDTENTQGKGVELTEFQQDAVAEAKQILRRYGGVVISDSTGLGKTHIGVELLRYLLLEKKQKVLLVAPAQVKDTVWEPRLLADSIKTKNISLESVGQPTFDPSEYLDFDIVLIDESHNFRSPGAKRRVNMMKILAGGRRKKVILLSATPINNSIMDLYYQVSLLTTGSDAYFANLDIPDLRSHFVQAANKKEVKESIDSIVRLLDEIMIKRTRKFIKYNYPEATLNGKQLNFPRRNLHKVEYSLTKLYGANVYHDVIRTIENMHLVPYKLVVYDKSADDDEKKRAEHISVLQKIILAKRFESSIEAIRSSISRLEQFYAYFERAMKQDKIINRRQLDDLLENIRSDHGENDEDALRRALNDGGLELESLGSHYDKKQMTKDLREDMAMLANLAKKLTQIQPEGDSKLQKLEDDLEEYNVFKRGGKKAVIFTSYVDTAVYIHNYLKPRLASKQVLLLTGQKSARQRSEALKKFAPRSNYLDEDEIPADLEEADVLITTEILSEGQNLQDCNYVINYDLPWNPMRIAQRVGRVDRLTSRFSEITSAVFIPEKELNELLGIMEKLEQKIKDIGDVVGSEGSILGEKENPKTFNALERIKSNDPGLIDEIEEGSDLFGMITPYQEILSYVKNLGSDTLQTIKPGRRSGRRSDHSGVILMYREKNTKDVHMVMYDHKKSEIDSMNDVTRLFSYIKCDSDEDLSLPFQGSDSFNYIKMASSKARAEILKMVNKGTASQSAQSTGGKFQSIIRDIIQNGYQSEKSLAYDDIGETYNILNTRSLVAWEFELREIAAQYNMEHDIMLLLKRTQALLAKYKIELEPPKEMQKVNEEDLQIIGCMFLDGSAMKNTKISV